MMNGSVVCAESFVFLASCHFAMANEKVTTHRTLFSNTLTRTHANKQALTDKKNTHFLIHSMHSAKGRQQNKTKKESILRLLLLILIPPHAWRMFSFIRMPLCFDGTHSQLTVFGPTRMDAFVFTYHMHFLLYFLKSYDL